MPRHSTPDAIVVGSGPNGLAAAITLARAGRKVTLFEANETVGGGICSDALTLPGFVHDRCSAVHPLGVGASFFPSLPLARYGFAWIHPPAPLAHPFDDGTAAVLERSLDTTCDALGADAWAYRQLLAPFVADYEKLAGMILAPLLRIPRHPVLLARFGIFALLPARLLATSAFKHEHTRALFGGMAAHAVLPLEHSATASFALVLAIFGHSVGWPMPRGGAQRLADALAEHLRSLGGAIVTGARIEALEQLPPSRAVLLNVTARQLLQIAGERLPAGYRRCLKGFRYGPGVFKMDWALDAPIPWRAQACARAGTVHLGGTLEEVAAYERAVWHGEHSEKPFVVLTQPSLFDPTRAPAGKHTVWAYCHVPHGSTVDMSARIEAQIERFAPGFGARILARSVLPPAALQQHDANYIGGDITGGVHSLWQLFARPTLRLNPYVIPVKGLYLCSSSTPPGGGVHGMCGYHAARAALQESFRE